MNPPAVTVIIPVRDRAQWLARAVQSCWQPGVSVEVIVVDDGSREEMTAKLPPPPPPPHALRVLRQPPLGACAARNTGLDRASGEFVKFLDSDDELIPGVLEREVAALRAASAEVLVTGWEERWRDADGREDPARRKTVPAPDLGRGIDDMLLGRSPWTSAALYRRAFVQNLRWDPAWTKAQDWGWALTVCLAGARFARLEAASAIYYHHAGSRLSAAGDRFARSTDARQFFLQMIETRLREKNELTPERRRLLAQYYYRDARVLCARSRREWRELWRHCRELSAGFRPREPVPLLRLFFALLGVYHGVCAYVFLQRLAARFMGRRRTSRGD